MSASPGQPMGLQQGFSALSICTYDNCCDYRCCYDGDDDYEGHKEY